MVRKHLRVFVCMYRRDAPGAREDKELVYLASYLKRLVRGILGGFL